MLARLSTRYISRMSTDSGMSGSDGRRPASDPYAAWAEFYDLIYASFGYPEQAAKLRTILQELGVPDGARVLDAACGTGAHLAHLQPWYAVAGFDRSEAMLARARARVPGADLFIADMADFSVSTPYDAVLCLFSSLGYLHGPEVLAKAAECFARAVAPGGVLLVEPWVSPDDFEPGRTAQDTYESDALKLCRAAVPQRRDDMAVIDFHWLVTRRQEGVRYFIDRHELWLCPHETIAATFEAAGFACDWREEGIGARRGLLVGRRRE